MDKFSPLLQHPDEGGSAYQWLAYWKAQNQQWRIEPEIDAERQKYLTECLINSISQGKLPFKDIFLSRADVEWLIAIGDGHEIEDQSNGQVHKGLILHLSFADLHGVDLSGLPLERADLYQAFLEEANLARAQLQGANLERAFLKEATLLGAHLEGANFSEAHLEGADLSEAHLEGAKFIDPNLIFAHRSSSIPIPVQHLAHLERANFSNARLEEAILFMAHLERANFSNAHLEKANLSNAYLEEASLFGAHLEGANLEGAHLEGADLRFAYFSSASTLDFVSLGNESAGFVLLNGIRWGGVDLSIIDWTQVRVLGDEQWARQLKLKNYEMKYTSTYLDFYRGAVRANRQLAIALQGQGINEEAANFAYRAQLLQRMVFKQQRKFGQYLLSLFLDLLAGYGYKPIRSMIAYLTIIFGFMCLYLLNAHFTTPHLRWDEALVLSVSSFHGRGFFSQNITLGDTYARLAASEAVVGLLIEVSLIATFTQRFFGK